MFTKQKSKSILLGEQDLDTTLNSADEAVRR